jgi:hypothetical protein
MHCIVVESIPSVGLAVVDSMLPRRIKAFGSHAQAFSVKNSRHSRLMEYCSASRGI